MATPSLDYLSINIGANTFSALSAGPVQGELVLFLHGFPEFADSWRSILPRFGEAGYRAVAFDQRGYSQKARPANIADYHLQHTSADALAIAEKLAGDKPFHLVGHDWGAVIGWWIAAHHPARLKTFSALSVPHLDAFLHAVKHDPEQMKKSSYVLLFKAPGHLAEKSLLLMDAALLRRTYQSKLPAEMVERNVIRLREEGALTAALNWYRALDMDLQIGPVEVPTLYIWGEDDVALGRKAAEDTAHHVSGRYRFLPLEGKSHWLVHDSPNEVCEAILNFIAE